MDNLCGLINGNWFFNPHITKQAIEVIFSCKNKKPDYPELPFNDIPIARQPVTKHLRGIIRWQDKLFETRKRKGFKNREGN